MLIQVLLFPFAATLEVTNATIAIYNEDSGRHAVELTPALCPRQSLYPRPAAAKLRKAIQPNSIDEQKLCWWCASRPISAQSG
ncbi:hypothetical protein LNP74_26310 [Klebsiella pneumoniae subsp. pneumoniae]|nr:hypothetical protein [Klebsiella pneumoniae subsp. pneumoniae]